MTPVEEIVELARQADVKLSQSFNATDVLPFATKALSIIRAHPNLQSEFERAFLEMPSYAPAEFVQVCMHVLRWTNVRREFEKRQESAVAANDWRREPVYRNFLEAFDSGWEDAQDFYAEYFNPKNKT